MHAFPRQLEVMQLNGSQSLSCKLGSPVYESLLVMRYLIALLCNPVHISGEVHPIEFNEAMEFQPYATHLHLATVTGIWKDNNNTTLQGFYKDLYTLNAI